MKIVVTGARGQLGREICRQLGSDAIPMDFEELDLARGPLVRQTIAELEPDAVINCAAFTNVDQAESQSKMCHTVNALAVRHLVAACKELDCPLVQISTDYVFGGDLEHDQPYREDDKPQPLAAYGRSKLAGERNAAEYEKHLIVRTCGLYADPSDDRAKNFARTILRMAEHRHELKIVDDQHCTPSYVPHVARAVLFLLGVTGEGPAPWGIYHVTNRGATTWYDFAAELLRLAGQDVELHPITTAEYGPTAARPLYSVLDTTKYHALGGPAMPDWKEALAEYMSQRNV